MDIQTTSRLEEVSQNHSISRLGYHIVFCPKFRNLILKDAVEMELRHIFGQTALVYNWKIHAMEIMPDHVHLFMQLLPDDRLTDVVRTLKSISAVHIFNKFPKLKQQKFWGTGLWSRGAYYATIGSVSEAAIRHYIENQKSKSNSSR